MNDIELTIALNGKKLIVDIYPESNDKEISGVILAAMNSSDRLSGILLQAAAVYAQNKTNNGKEK
jgi:hypothetical protein